MFYLYIIAFKIIFLQNTKKKKKKIQCVNNVNLKTTCNRISTLIYF